MGAVARDFDAVDDICYRTGSEAAFEFTSTESYTLACWVRHDSLTNYQRYIHKGASGSVGGYVFGKTDPANGDHLQYVVTATTLLTVDGTTAMSANTWYFAAVVVSRGAVQVRLYLATVSGDVVQEASVTDTTVGTHGSIAQGFGVGRNTDTAVEPMNGRVAEVSVWSRALTVPELRAVKWGGLKDRAGLLGYWPLWGVADPEPDLSGNGRHLAVHQAVRADHAPVGTYAPFPLGA